MKKLFKSAAVLTVAALMAVCSVGFAACEDIKQLELDLSLYNYTGNAFYAESDVKFSVDLYRHLAPKTVDKVLEHVKAGYYDNAIFYQDASDSSLIFIGDLKFENGELKQNLINGRLPSEIYGEFEANGTTGSNLVSEKGAIGIWRSYYEQDKSYTTSSDARDSGRATLYMPTSTKSAYNGYFCVFATFDTADDANAKALSAITSILSNNSTEYVIYYTGEYDAAKADENYGLTFNAVKAEDFDKNTEVFESEGKQLVCFNKKTVKIPNEASGEISAKIKSIKVK